MSRVCSKNGCPELAVSTLTYDYDELTAVLGPLSFEPEPRAYDLCGKHTRSFRAPEGWEVIRHLELSGDGNSI